jgi:toxin ParE1/3/4
MAYRVNITASALAQIDAVYDHVALEASPDTARRFTDSIVAQCAGLQTLPHRGVPRDDLRPGLRQLSFRRRVTIIYSVRDDQVSIIGVFYGGQDFETALGEE